MLANLQHPFTMEAVSHQLMEFWGAKLATD